MVYKTPPGGEVNHIWLVAYWGLLLKEIIFSLRQILSFLRNPIFPSDTVSTVEEEYNKDMKKKMIWKIAKCQGKISEKSGNLKVEDKRQPYLLL